MYTYIIESADFQLHTPGVGDYSLIKNQTRQEPDKLFIHSEYPTGLVLDIEQTATRVVICSNRRLYQNQDGSFTAPEQ